METQKPTLEDIVWEYRISTRTVTGAKGLNPDDRSIALRSVGPLRTIHMPHSATVDQVRDTIYQREGTTGMITGLVPRLPAHQRRPNDA